MSGRVQQLGLREVAERAATVESAAAPLSTEAAAGAKRPRQRRSPTTAIRGAGRCVLCDEALARLEILLSRHSAEVVADMLGIGRSTISTLRQARAGVRASRTLVALVEARLDAIFLRPPYAPTTAPTPAPAPATRTDGLTVHRISLYLSSEAAQQVVARCARDDLSISDFVTRAVAAALEVRS